MESGTTAGPAEGAAAAAPSATKGSTTQGSGLDLIGLTREPDQVDPVWSTPLWRRGRRLPPLAEHAVVPLIGARR